MNIQFLKQNQKLIVEFSIRNNHTRQIFCRRVVLKKSKSFANYFFLKHTHISMIMNFFHKIYIYEYYNK